MATETLRSGRWDYGLITSTALLVPYPIVAYYLCRNGGLSVGTSEDLVTLLVMLPLGGPHVVATFLRTITNREFRRGERTQFWASWALWGIVFLTAVLSVFAGVRVAGLVPMQLLLTVFFFWASFHVLQQTAFCVQSFETKEKESRGWRLLELAVLFGSLYPLAFFRMAMIDGSSPEAPRADPSALATQVFLGLGASASLADEYVFRIGRTVPVLPKIARLDLWWILGLVAYATAFLAYLGHSYRQWRAGVLERRRFHLVALTGGIGFFLPIVPNLDTAFQGMNAWHCAQYLRLSWLLHREERERGESQHSLARWYSARPTAWPYYLVCLAFTVGALAILFGVAAAIQLASGGHWRMLGFEASALGADPRTGGLEYRPGSLLIAYYLMGFGFLLMHYLQDSWFFLQRGALRTKLQEELAGPEPSHGPAGMARGA